MFRDSVIVPYLLVFFYFINLFFKILMYLVISRIQWLISAEGEITQNFGYYKIYKTFFFF
jgi:hypothetical protein